jgi:MoaA/NifB/PqqE/SkfB family radical SAM enzyme
MNCQNKPTLETLTIELIRRCPNRCLHCSTGSSPVARDIIPFTEVRRIVSQAKSLGLQKVILSGGEPLIYPELLPLVEYLRNEDLNVVIYTSGSAITEAGPSAVSRKLLEVLVRHRCGFNLSLHSSLARIHDLFMDTAGSWERAVGFLRATSELAWPLDVHTVLTRMNFDKLRELAQFLRAFSIRSLRLLRLVPQGRAQLHFNELELSGADWITVAKDLKDLQQAPPVFPIKLGAHIPAAVTGHTYECSLDQAKLLVEPNGRVSVCPALKGSHATFAPPSVRSAPLVQILTSEWRETVAALKTSAGCDCPAQSLYRALQQTNAEFEESPIHGQTAE